MSSYVLENLVKNEEVVYWGSIHWISFISLRAFLSLFILPLIDNWTSEYAVTNKRVIIKVGLIRRRTVEMNISKIESINVDQSILGRILGYGDIVIVGTGGTRESFETLSSPTQFRRKFQELQNELP
jgi:uncharacterized membrane protein YdbT with pleckstrin-like domain